ncbi:MAG: molybdopterin-dependent oxidoreductase [Deltaproteobacteria bacterium]|nr:molybdopterin-dependent oxidoreductase [Deltaproteobacteria bacterium]
MSELTAVGKPIQRVDAEEKITGQAVYGYDLVLPDMLYGKTLFSPKAHARIKRINTEKAKAYPGVVAVVTAEDAPWTHGETVKDKPFLAQGKVRCIGEPVAAVAAEDEDTAEAAVKLIEVEYEDLPVYTDPEEACKPGCVEIHEDFGKYRKADFIVKGAAPNVAEHFKLRTGDVDIGFKQSDVIVEERYFVPIIQHAAMEPHSAHAQFDKESGRLTIWVANDAPFRALHEITEALGMPKEKIRFINPLQGGGFGSKGGLKVEPIAVALAFHTNGRPVRVKFNREETFISTLTRHEAVVYSKTGVKKDGTLMARAMTIYWGAGAYAEKSPTVCIRGSLPAPGPYRIPHVKVDGYAVYTNKPVAGSYRGYGIPQGAWAGEQQMDEIAKRLGMDPIAIRMKNMFVEGDISYWGEQLHAVGLKETLVKATEAIDWGKPTKTAKPGVKIGKGFACIQKPTRSPTTSAAGVLVNAKGEVTVLAGTVEIGQGCNTILSQVAAEELISPAGKSSHAPTGHRCDPLRRLDHLEPQHLSHGQRRAPRLDPRARTDHGSGRPDVGGQGAGPRLRRRQSFSQRPAPAGVAHRRSGAQKARHQRQGARRRFLHLRDRQRFGSRNRPQRPRLGVLHVRDPGRRGRGGRRERPRPRLAHVGRP